MSLDAFSAAARKESARFRSDGQTAETARAAQARARAAGKRIGRPPNAQNEVLNFLQVHGPATVKHIAATTQRPRNSVESALRALTRDGKAEKLDRQDKDRSFYWMAKAEEVNT